MSHLSSGQLGMTPSNPRPKEWTQEDQDKEDEKNRKKAEKDLEKSWMDRLQLISVITTFFASTEAQLLSITAPDKDAGSNSVDQLTNATLSAALVFHSFAAIFSFVAAFVLVRFRMQEAKREQNENIEKQDIWSSDPHVAMQCLGYQEKKPPMHLLRRYHSLCVWLSVAGFILAATGILSFVWERQARSVGIFSSISLLICIIGGLGIPFLPANNHAA